MSPLPLIAVLISSYAGGNAQPVLEDHVDLIEINHHYDENGWLVMDQVIFYQWCSVKSRYRVRDWRPLKSFTQVPTKDHPSGKFITIWNFTDYSLIHSSVDIRGVATFLSHTPVEVGKNSKTELLNLKGLPKPE